MTTTRLNRWLQPLAILLVIVLIVMLLIPAELTDEQLAQIRPGMTMEEVDRRIGKSNVTECWSLATLGDPGSSAQDMPFLWLQSERWLRPNVEARLPENSISLNTKNQSLLWMGKSSLLWVEHDQGKVQKVWLIPVTKKGGGLQGCVNTFREYWNKWWK